MRSGWRARRIRRPCSFDMHGRQALSSPTGFRCIERLAIRPCECRPSPRLARRRSGDSPRQVSRHRMQLAPRRSLCRGSTWSPARAFGDQLISKSAAQPARSARSLRLAKPAQMQLGQSVRASIPSTMPTREQDFRLRLTGPRRISRLPFQSRPFIARSHIRPQSPHHLPARANLQGPIQLRGAPVMLAGPAERRASRGSRSDDHSVQPGDHRLHLPLQDIL